MARLALITMATVALSAVPAGAHVTDEDSGRRVWLGDYAGLVRCEAPAHGQGVSGGGDADESNHWNGQARGAFQFLPSTWQAVGTRRHKPALAAKDPRAVTLAQQLRQAVWLHEHVGLWQWDCAHSYGAGSGWIVIYDEQRHPARPARCARNLRARHGLSAKVARSVCEVPR
jgi:hypothetical protein